MYRIGIAVLACCVTLTLAAQEKNTKCKDELARICPGSAGDGAKIGACLRDPEKLKQLSPECKPRRVDFPAIKRACATEIESFCQSAPNDGKLYQCLRVKINNASTAVGQSCKDEMNR